MFALIAHAQLVDLFHIALLCHSPLYRAISWLILWDAMVLTGACRLP